MISVSARFHLACAAVLLFCAIRAPLSASPMSDFSARLAQTIWSLQQVEAILRSQPTSSVAVPTPDALASYLDLASQNVTALCELATQRVTDEQRRAMGDGLKSVTTLLKDQGSLAVNRGLPAVSGELGSLEAASRGAIVR